MKLEKVLQNVAALITIINLLIVLLTSLAIENFVFENLDMSKFTTSLRITFTVILELSLASFFGYSMCFSIKKLDGNTASTIIAVSIVSMVSAWVSFFNIEYVLLGGIELNGFWTFFGLFFLFVLAWALGSFFIDAHFEQLDCDIVDEVDESYIPIIIQAIAFILIFIGATIQ